MVKTPYISVILPVYNAEKYIAQSIQSILNQTFEDFELIVVDDGSTDQSLSIIQTFHDPRLLVLRHDRNLGYPFAMNTGLSHARGKYIARMDADDVCHPMRLERQVQVHEENPEVALVSCLRYWITPNGIPYTLRSQMAMYTGEVYYETWEDVITRRKKFTDSGVVALRDRIMSVGGYRTYQLSGMDIDLWLRLMEYTCSPAAVIAEPLYGRRLIPDSIVFNPETMWRNEVPRLLAVERMKYGLDRVAENLPLDDIYEQARNYGSKPNQHLNFIRFLVTYAAQSTLAGDLRGARWFLKSAIKINHHFRIYTIFWLFLKKLFVYIIKYEVIRINFHQNYCVRLHKIND